MSSSSDSDFDGYLEDYSVVDTVVDGSDISISDVDTDDLSSDDAGDGSNDAGGDQEFSETLQDVDILPFRERVGPAHSLPPDASELSYFLLLFTIEMISQTENNFLHLFLLRVFATYCAIVGGIATDTCHRDRCFPKAAALLWNSLPANLRDMNSIAAFQRGLKTFLFRQEYENAL